MKKIILTFLVCLFLSGCSLIPRLTFDTTGTTPQSIDKSKLKYICKGEIQFDTLGNIISCSKGYFNYSENYVKKERKYTFKEKIINLFNNLSGWTFWIAIALIIFCPGVLGWIMSRVFNGINSAFTQTVTGIKKYRQLVSAEEKEKLDTFLKESQDVRTKQIIAKEKLKWKK